MFKIVSNKIVHRLTIATNIEYWFSLHKKSLFDSKTWFMTLQNIFGISETVCFKISAFLVQLWVLLYVGLEQFVFWNVVLTWFASLKVYICRVSKIDMGACTRAEMEFVVAQAWHRSDLNSASYTDQIPSVSGYRLQVDHAATRWRARRGKKQPQVWPLTMYRCLPSQQDNDGPNISLGATSVILRNLRASFRPTQRELCQISLITFVAACRRAQFFTILPIPQCTPRLKACQLLSVYTDSTGSLLFCHYSYPSLAKLLFTSIRRADSKGFKRGDSLMTVYSRSTQN